MIACPWARNQPALPGAQLGGRLERARARPAPSSPRQTCASAWMRRSAPGASPRAPQAMPRSARSIAAPRSLAFSACSAARRYQRDRSRRLVAAAEVLGQHHGVARPAAPATRRPGGGRARDRRRSAWRRPPRAPARARTSARRRRRRASGAGIRASSSRAHSRSSQSLDLRRPRASPPSSAATPPREKRSPKTLAARSTRRASGLGVEARLHHGEHRVGQRLAAAVGGGADQLLQVEGVAVGAVDDLVDHRVADVARRSASRTSFSPPGAAAAPGGSSAARARPTGAGSARATSGRASASTISGCSRRLRSARVDEAHRAAGRPSAGPRARAAPGRAAHSAASQSSQARRMPSPISCGFCARRAQRVVVLVGERRCRRISPRNAATRGRDSRSTWRADPQRSLRRFSSAARRPGCPAARRSARRASRTASRAQRVAAPNSTSARCGRRCTHSTSSWRRRDLPAPAGPVTSTALAIDSAGGAGEQVGQHRHLAPAAHELGRPCPAGCASPRRRRARRAGSAGRPVAVDLEARVQQPGRHVVEADRPGRRAAQQAHAAVDHLADHRPGREARRARSRSPAATSGNAARTRQRAARRARRLVGRLAAVGQRRAPSSRRAARAPARRGRSPSSVSSASSVDAGSGPPPRAPLRRRRRRSSATMRTVSPRHSPLGRWRRPGQHDAGDPLLAGGQRRAAAAAAAPAPASVRSARARPARRSTARHVGQALRRILGQHARHQIVERRAAARGDQSRTRGASCSRILASSADASSASKTGAPGQALEQHAAQREDVGAGGDVALAAHLLGRHVAGRAHHRPGARQLRARRARAARCRSPAP